MNSAFDVYKVEDCEYDGVLKDHVVKKLSLVDQIEPKSKHGKSIMKCMREGLFCIPEYKFVKSGKNKGKNKGCGWKICREMEDLGELRIVTERTRVPKYILREVCVDQD